MIKPNKVVKKKSSDAFKNLPATTSQRSIQDFWAWAYSDLLQNTTRGVLAEYLVALLLDIDKTPRNPWDAYDLILKDGTTIEVKAMSRLQGWVQTQLSSPRVVLGPTRAWDPLTGKMELEPTFNADIYVFCYFHAESHTSADPMNLDQWLFYVLSKDKLIEALNNRKSIALKDLEKNNVHPLSAHSVPQAIQSSKPSN